MKRNIFLIVVLIIAVSAFNTTFAHCDSIEGPVVKAS